VKFDPSDQELLGHLLAKVGKGIMGSHPFINEFIPTVDEDDGICYTHPQKLPGDGQIGKSPLRFDYYLISHMLFPSYYNMKFFLLPGVKLDGSVSHFFHRTFKAYSSGTRKRRKIQQNDDNEHTGGLGGDVRWHKTGKTKPVIIDGVHIGCKKIMVLYSSLKKGEKHEKTNWVMHQYHLGTGEDEKDGEFVVSKIFYQQQPVSKPFDNNKNELQHLPMTLVETLEAEPVIAATLEVALDVAVHQELSPSLTTSPQNYVSDEHHPRQASSNQV